jgi:hypothetical protein
MINEGEYKEALGLCMSLTPEELPNRSEKVRNIKILDAYDLFNKGQYTAAMENFFSENVRMISPTHSPHIQTYALRKA